MSLHRVEDNDRAFFLIKVRRYPLLGFFVFLPFIFLLAQSLPEANGADTAADAGVSALEKTYQDAERFYLNRETGAALQVLNKLLTSSENLSAKVLIRAHNLKGLIFFQGRNIQGSVQEFESAVQLANKNLEATESLLHLTRYNLGNALFQVNRHDDSLEMLVSVNPSALDLETRVRFHHLYGNVLATKNRELDALVQFLTAAHLAKDIGARDTYLQKALNTSKNLYLKDPQSDLKRISSFDFPQDSASGVATMFFLARGEMYSGNASSAEDLLKKAISNAEPNHPLRSKAEEMLADLNKLSDVNPKTLGILLPLSGKFAKFGRLCLNAILMAQGPFEEMTATFSGNDFRLAIRDSGETPESAQEKFEELIKEEKAIAVIGPLLSKQFSSVARKAQEYGVPLFSLSQRVEENQMGSYVFPIALSPKQQIEMIVKHSIETNGYRRFAILAPDDSFGREYMNLFWTSVESSGGEVVGVELYEPKSTDFREEVKRLLGLEYLGARRIEIEDLKRRADVYGSTLKVKGKLRQRMMKAFDPKAVVDFDALFIPDDPATVGQIAPAFAVQDVSNIPILGINTWNTAELVQRAGRYMQRSLFVDGFFISSQKPMTVQFVQDYMKYYQSTPGTIEVQAHDAAQILFTALKEGSPDTRSKLKDQLLNRGNFLGISGEFRFTPEGVVRAAHLLTVKGNSIVEVPKAPGPRPK